MQMTSAQGPITPVDHGQLPEYEEPPVIEVVCGIHFEELTSLQAVHLGSLWSKLRGCQKTGSMKNRGYVVTSIRMCKQTTAAASVVQASIVVAERS